MSLTWKQLLMSKNSKAKQPEASQDRPVSEIFSKFAKSKYWSPGQRSAKDNNATSVIWTGQWR